MTNKRSLRLTLICVTLMVIIQVTHQGWRNQLDAQSQRAAEYLPSPVAMKMLSLGFDQVLADFYWLGFVQYVGDTPGRQKDKYADAEKYVDLIVTLNPKLVQVYYFAAFIIGSEEKQPSIAAKIIDRGIAANQENWYLPFIAGINQYLYAHNDVRAAKYYRMAAKFPDAPNWLGRQAEILGAKIPSVIKEVNVWDRIYYSSKDALVKEKARRKLQSLWIAVYKTSPSAQIKKRALEQLNLLGAAPL